MIKELLGEYARTLNKKFAHDRRQTVGASEVGLCERRVYLTKVRLTLAKGVAIEETGSWGAHVRGSVMEEHLWVPAVTLKYGKRLQWVGREQRTFAKGNLSATPDGILTGVKDELREFGVKTVKSGCAMLECKTIDPRVTMREAKAENRFQVQSQMGLVRDCTKYKPDYAVISYTNASFWDECDEYVVEFDPKIYAAAHARADKIMSATKMEDLKPEGYISGEKECEYCPFTKECYGQMKSVPQYEVDPRTLDPQFVEMIQQMCDEAVALRRDGEKSAAAETAKKLEIKEELRKRGLRKIKGIVSWSPVKGASRYDNEAIRREAESLGVDVESFKTTGEPTDRFQIL